MQCSAVFKEYSSDSGIELKLYEVVWRLLLNTRGYGVVLPGSEPMWTFIKCEDFGLEPEGIYGSEFEMQVEAQDNDYEPVE